MTGFGAMILYASLCYRLSKTHKSFNTSTLHKQRKKSEYVLLIKQLHEENYFRESNKWKKFTIGKTINEGFCNSVTNTND